MNNRNDKNRCADIVDNFCDQYSREFDFYNAASLLAAQLIEAQLNSRGIRAIVTSRAKNPSRLKDKITKRVAEEKKSYTDSEDIYSDIVDLAGIRIALYFNSEQDELEQIIHDIFEVHKKKEFPTKEKSQGYKAVHYRGIVRDSMLTEQQKRYSKANIEIQVASLLMHAWAEVEHDIVYKPLQGKVSEAEQNALDTLNHIVLQGEIALKNLQQATYKRNAFNDHYDLYGFLVQYISEKYNIQEEQVFIGDVKKLYDYLFYNDFGTQTKLKNRIKELEIILDEHWTISDQIMDYIEGNCKTKSQSYLLNTKYSGKKDISTESAVGTFLFAWIELEKVLKGHDMGTSYKDTFIRLKSLVDVGVLSKDEYERIYIIRSVRNNLVHGIEIPDTDYLSLCTQEIKELTQNLKNKRQKSYNS